VKLWVDAQLSPALAPWLAQSFEIEAQSIRYVGLRDAEDEQIFFAAREAAAIVVTKDQDFIELVRRHRPPPQILWVRCGNTSNARLRLVLEQAWNDIVDAFGKGEPVVELRDAK
jgi:predicted nuclease of predicted toxin-antitoxin system